MPKLRLPPLPPSQKWSVLHPRVRGKSGMDGGRELVRRVVLASKPIADRFVRDLGIRKGEVVLEAYPSVGQTTRSFLAGGYDETTAKDWHQAVREQKVVAGKVEGIHSGEFDFPPWDVDMVPEYELPALKKVEEITVPKAVIALEPMVAQSSRGLGLDPKVAPVSRWDYDKVKTTEELADIKEKRFTTPIYHSPLQKNLYISPASAFDWETIPKILENPVVWEQLPIYDKTKEGLEARKRPWSAPPPPITLAATIPDTVMGDQLMSQWIASCVGQVDDDRGWMWAFGRVRLAVLVSKGLYDRIMASPGETIHCKLSVMAGALFHLRPLPPYHHVPDVDKQGTRTDPSYDTAIQGVRLKKRSSVPSPPPINEVTTTTLSDFWPHMGRVIGKAANSKVTPEMVLTRPPLLGIELIPRDDMYVKLDQREEWEFVLRHCFVQEAQPIGDVIPSLGFGAENLLPKIAESAETSKYVGEPVDLSLQTRAVNVEQWARIVDVFAKWPFKPDLLLLEAGVDESRQIGTT